MADKPKLVPPMPKFGQPEKTNWIRMIVFGFFVLASLLGIVWMIEKSPREPDLVCGEEQNEHGSLTSWGRCHAE